MDERIAGWARQHGIGTQAFAELQGLLEPDPFAGPVSRPHVGHSAVPFTIAPTEGQSDDPLVAFGAHLTVIGPLGSGGMGDVLRVRDQRLEREVALKVLQERHAGSPHLRTLFLAEARAQAQLAHPGVVPVHEIGELDDGRPYFTMEINRGRTLAEVLSEGSGGLSRRVVDLIRRASEVVAYAHSRGVVHRDLKPGNIMVGHFGEVQVLDWGLVQRTDEAAGGPVGTPAWMSPEQARGEPVDARSDVYSLGAILFEAVTGKRMVSGRDAVHRVARGEVEPLPSTVPAELAELVGRATEPEADARFPDAGALSEGLSAWLDGARRRARAVEVLDRATALKPAAEARQERAAAFESDASQMALAVLPSAPIAEKATLWETEDTASTCRQQARTAERDRIDLLLQALSHDPELPEARAELAGWYRDQVVAAETRGDDPAGEAALDRLRFYDDGSHGAFLTGDGAVTLHTDPPGAQVRLHRMVLRDRRLVPEYVRDLGPTPLESVSLPRGSWLLTLHAPGREVVKYPVFLGRLEHWHGIPPGGSAPRPVWLPERGLLGPDDCYVPASWFGFGSDSGVPATWAAQKRWEPGFLARRFPVTNREYLPFMDALVAAGREEEALACVPRAPRAQGADEIEPVYGRDADGRHLLVHDGEGDLWLPEWPVISITWEAARTFAAWESERTGVSWDLPTETQWEKAARGVDGRTYPWGEHFDSTFALVYDSFPDRPNLAPVQAFPHDESVYGVQGMAGGVREWCLPRFGRAGSEPPPFDTPGDRLFRGGCWHFTKATAHTTARSRLFQGRASDLGGFRLFGGIPGGSAGGPDAS